MRIGNHTGSFLGGLSLLTLGCGGAEDAAKQLGTVPLECERVVSEADCDESLRPIVFVHGTFGSGDNIAHVAKLFGSNGYCQDRLVAIDYNSLGGDPADLVDDAIEAVLKRTGHDKVDLLGHSQGAGHAYNYVSHPDRAKRIAHYIHLAGSSYDAPPSPDVPTLALASEADSAVGPSKIEGAESVIFKDLDHMAVASSTKAFVEIYTFLMGEEPEFKKVQCGDETLTLEGVAVSFGDNVIQEGITIEFYELDGEPFERGEPVATRKVGEDGHIAPFEAKRGVEYESRALAESGEVIGHQYFGASKRSDYLMRALMPSKGLITSAVTESIVSSPDHSVIIARTARGAFRADLGDSLKIDGEEVLLEENANAMTTTVAYFMFDENQNLMSDPKPLGRYSPVPFVEGTDVFMDATEPRYMKVEYNGTTLHVPAWPSASEGPTVVLFQ